MNFGQRESSVEPIDRRLRKLILINAIRINLQSLEGFQAIATHYGQAQWVVPDQEEKLGKMARNIHLQACTFESRLKSQGLQGDAIAVLALFSMMEEGVSPFSHHKAPWASPKPDDPRRFYDIVANSIPSVKDPAIWQPFVRS